MINLDESKIEKLAVDEIAERLIDSESLYNKVHEKIDQKIDAIFAEKVESLINDAADAAFKNGFEREFQPVTQWGEPKGEKTSIKNELEKLTSKYWSQKVDQNGRPMDSNYNAVTRAEYLMTKICAEDFSKLMRESALNVTGSLKDNFRSQIAKHVDELLNSLFKVKSLQDQGKVEKPW